MSFDSEKNDGSAVVKGDVLEIFDVDGLKLIEPIVINSSHINNGFVEVPFSNTQHADGLYLVSARITDLAGNVSYISNYRFEIDTTALNFIQKQPQQIIENSDVPQSIYQAEVAEDDLWKFELSEDSDSALSINSDSGHVSLNQIADYEVQQSYTFTVIATDKAGNESFETVTANVVNLDEVAPTITSLDTAERIDENIGASQIIYTATADDSSDIPTVPAGPVSYSLGDGSDPALSIDALTGAVTLSADPDYETQAQYSFSVIATNEAGNVSDAQAVTLDIDNLDEVAPTITSANSADAIDENSGVGQVIYTATADDSGDISDGVTFSLAEGSDPALSIDANTGAVTLNADPDHEAQSQHSFSVVATDAAGNASDAQSVTLDINDLDDAAPTITSGDTADAINENTGAGQVIYTAAADDSGDDIVVGPITFSLAEGSDSTLSIDASTGEVTLSTDPDHEIQSQYSFAVIATDGAGNASAAQPVSLAINNLDEIAPTITSSDTADAINENSGAGQVIYTATADDSADISAGVSFSLGEGSDSALSIDALTGAVTLSIDPDYETQAQYSFSVIATDEAGNASDAQAVTLDIDNLDEVAPTITSAATAIAIDENTGTGQVIYTATADDSADISDDVTFSLAEGSDSALSIDANTGAVTLNVDPDYEAQTQYSFMVVATDAAGNASDAQSVTLDINDVDDAAPTITSGEVANSIDENTGAGQVIYTAVADDSGDNIVAGPITYSLTENSDSALSIDASTGEVTLNVDPDHETQAQYSFAVIATDGAGNASAAQSVTLDINDLDDTAPTITSGDTATSIEENTGAGQVVYTVAADDSFDVSDGAALASGITGTDADAFEINSETGEVTLIEDADYDSQNTYNFIVTASDGVNPPAEKEITLQVLNVIDGPPVFTSNTVANIDENIGENQVVYTAVAESDGGNSTVQYTLEANDVHYYDTGSIQQSFINNNEGSYSYTMRLSIDDSTALASENFLENYDIFVAYNQNEIGLITDNNYEFLINVQGMKLVNLDLSDQEIANVDYEMASVDINVIAFGQLNFST